MTGELSANTQAILLLTAPLIVGSANSGEWTISAGDYSRLAVRLRELAFWDKASPPFSDTEQRRGPTRATVASS